MPELSQDEVVKLDKMDHAIVAVLLFAMLSFLFKEVLGCVRGRRRIIRLQQEVQAFEGAVLTYHCSLMLNVPYLQL